jgi:hypothetical protein
VANSTGPVEIGDDLNVSGSIGLGQSAADKIEFGGLGGGGPTISQGSAAPTSAEPDGSLYLRTTGQLYLRTGGAWVLK